MKQPPQIAPGNTPITFADVCRWAQELSRLHERIAPRFARSEPRHRALAFLRGVVSSIERKNGWQLAEHAGEARPDGMQRLLTGSIWDVDGVRDDLRAYVLEHLGDPQAILVIDETSFPKRGHKSAGVGRQYCGTTGRVENCQVGVFLAYVSAKGHSLLDRELYLPLRWAEDRQRCRAAGIPDIVPFQTKCELARVMMERIWNAQIPISWVVADSVYGSNLDLRLWIEQHQYSYVLAVTCDELVGIETPSGRTQVTVAEAEARLLRPDAWQRLSMSEGTKGPRLFEWAIFPRLHQWQDDGRHFVLVRRSLTDPLNKTYYFVFAPVGTPLLVLVHVVGARWHIEEDFETAKDMGLDHYEVRSFSGWYRHVTLVMLAHACLAVICSQEQALSESAPSGSVSAEERSLLPVSIPEVRHLLGLLLWPLPRRICLLLAWSQWRRRHRSVASSFHRKRRLLAGSIPCAEDAPPPPG